jgi:hypothetical protein
LISLESNGLEQVKLRLAIVTNVRWDAVSAQAETDERGSMRTAKSCGPGAPVLAPSLVDRNICKMTVATKLGQRRARRKP